MHLLTPAQTNLLSILVALNDWEGKHLPSSEMAAGRSLYFEMAESLLSSEGQGSAETLLRQSAVLPTPAFREALSQHLAQFQAVLENRFVLLEK